MSLIRNLLAVWLTLGIFHRIADESLIRFFAVAMVSVLVSVGFVGETRADRPIIRDVRIGADADRTRFVLEFSESVPYKIFTLAAPGRVVIDLPQTDWSAVSPVDTTARGLVAGYRYGAYQPGITRVVIDMARHGQVLRHFVLPADSATGTGPRVVVDLSPVAETQPTKVMESDGWADYATALAERRAASAVAPQVQQGKRVIVLDPGHGGVDPGAISTTGLREKSIVLAYARRLRDALEATGRYSVVMTRDTDIYLKLRDRYEVAHTVDAGLFISIHADSHRSARTRGFSVYTLSENASDKEAEALAQKENLSDVIAGTDLTGYEEDVTSILISLAQQSVKASSASFAEILVEEMGKTVQLLRNPHRFAGFAVLKSPNVPSVLVELGFLSNRADEKVLRTPERQQKMVTSMIKAIDEFFERKELLERS